MDLPKCYTCIHRRGLIGDCHSACNKITAKVEGHEHGIKNGWFMHPFNFDPVWLISCDSYKSNKEESEG